MLKREFLVDVIQIVSLLTSSTNRWYFFDFYRIELMNLSSQDSSRVGSQVYRWMIDRLLFSFLALNFRVYRAVSSCAIEWIFIRC